MTIDSHFGSSCEGTQVHSLRAQQDYSSNNELRTLEWGAIDRPVVFTIATETSWQALIR